MTIQRALELLIQIKDTHGNVEILFDCQHCGKVTKSSEIIAMVVVKEVSK